MIYALILAGGRGSRMGGADKGLLVHNGIALIDFQLNQARELGYLPLISANRNVAEYAKRGVPVISDMQTTGIFEGPMSGVAAAITWLESNRTVSNDDVLLWWAVDTWIVPQEKQHNAQTHYQKQLTDIASTGNGAVLLADNTVQPTLAAMPRSAWQPLAAAYHNGERSLFKWLTQAKVATVTLRDDDIMHNLNSVG